MYYTAKIDIADDGKYYVMFPDYPTVNTYGNNIEHAKEMALEALEMALEADIDEGFEMPESNEYAGDDYYKIPVSDHIALPYKIKKLRGKRTQSEIAHALNVSRQAYQKLENPKKCNPTIKTLEKVAKVFDIRVKMLLE